MHEESCHRFALVGIPKNEERALLLFFEDVFHLLLIIVSLPSSITCPPITQQLFPRATFETPTMGESRVDVGEFGLRFNCLDIKRSVFSKGGVSQNANMGGLAGPFFPPSTRHISCS